MTDHTADAKVKRLNDWLVDTQMLAHNWMVAHDRLKAGKPYDLPKPADLPEALAELKRENERLRAAITALEASTDAPTEAMWGGLARDIMMWLDMGDKTPRALFEHLERLGRDIPDWLRNEPEMQALNHVPSKGTRCVIIYEAMRRAATPTAPVQDDDAEWLRGFAWQIKDTRRGASARLKAIANRLSTADHSLVEALEKCRDKFAEYAEMHRQKLGTQRPLDNFEQRAIIQKVERNRDMADMCIAALAGKQSVEGQE